MHFSQYDCNCSYLSRAFSFSVVHGDICFFFFLCPPSQWTEEDEIADYERNMEWMDECMDGMLEKWYDKVVQGTLESRRKVNIKAPPDK